MSIQRIRNRVVETEIAVIEGSKALAQRSVNAFGKMVRGEKGQTPTEYLMIVGLMAVVIILVFVVFYWNNVKTAAKTWVNNVKQSVLGQNIMP